MLLETSKRNGLNVTELEKNTLECLLPSEWHESKSFAISLEMKEYLRALFHLNVFPKSH